MASILVLALTRAELLDRLKAPPVTQLDGLVQVYGDCPADMRREYQLPIASYVSDICRRLYAADNMRPQKFTDPGIVVRIGDVRTNIAEVVSRPAKRADGRKFTRIFVPSPGGADLKSLRREVVRAFCRATEGVDLDDAGVDRRLRHADPVARMEDVQAEVAAWRERGEYAADRTDEDYLKLMRGVHLPGVATEADVLTFASRLYLYPAVSSPSPRASTCIPPRTPSRSAGSTRRVRSARRSPSRRRTRPCASPRSRRYSRSACSGRDTATL